MVDDKAYSTGATASRTGVDALIRLAVLVSLAVGVQDTLWPASFVRIAEELGPALAYTEAIPVAAVRIGATWRWVARINLGSRWPRSRS